VTNAKVRVTAPKAYVPSEKLVQLYASRYSWKREELAAVLARFGPLPEFGQEQLIKYLVLAFGAYQLAALTKKRATAGERHKHLEKIEKTAQTLLRLVEHDPQKNPFAATWLEAAGVSAQGRDARTVNAELLEAHQEVENSIVTLRKLHKRAKAAADAAATQVDHKRGGTRRHPSAKGQLIRHAIETYHHMRGQYPESGNESGFGGPMKRFVRAVGELFDAKVTDGAVEEVWRCRESNTKQL
jgi:hypothetical protein